MEKQGLLGQLGKVVYAHLQALGLLGIGQNLWHKVGAKFLEAEILMDDVPHGT